MSLRAAPLSVRWFALSVLACLGVAYLLAMIYLFTQKVAPNKSVDVNVVTSVQYSYHGVPTAEPRVLVALRGTMSAYVSPQEFDLLKNWIDGGATEANYRAGTKSIIERNCISCHDEGGDPPLVRDYESVFELTAADTGVGLKKLAKATHIHVFGIPMVFFMLGALFIRTRWNESLKSLLVVVPFCAIMFDISHWWVTKIYASAALGIVVGGGFMGAGFAAQWFLTFFDIVLPYRGKPVAPPPEPPEPEDLAQL